MLIEIKCSKVKSCFTLIILYADGQTRFSFLSIVRNSGVFPKYLEQYYTNISGHLQYADATVNKAPALQPQNWSPQVRSITAVKSEVPGEKCSIYKEEPLIIAIFSIFIITGINVKFTY